MKTLRSMRLVLAIAILSIAGMTVSCGGGGGGCAEATVNVEGIWDITETRIVSSDCPDPQLNTYTATVTQDDNGGITVTINGDTFTGQICGDNLNWSGSFPNTGGTTTVDSTDITATALALGGTASWHWTDGDITCVGVTELVGTKQ